MEYCIDAILHVGICKFINDAPKRVANALMRVVDGDPPTLRLFARRSTNVGEEIRYTYHEDTSRMWWRREERYLKPFTLPLNVPSVSIQAANEAILDRTDKGVNAPAANSGFDSPSATDFAGTSSEADDSGIGIGNVSALSGV